MLHEEETIYFKGEDWQKIKRWADKVEKQKVAFLVGTACSHDEANRIRGALSMLKQLLALETDAAKAALRNLNA